MTAVATSTSYAWLAHGNAYASFPGAQVSVRTVPTTDDPVMNRLTLLQPNGTEW
jgi:hypothetical protein